MNSASGADALCAGDPGRPDGGVWKALLVDGTSRRASQTKDVGDGQLDWVLLPNRRYVRASDGAEVMVTDSNSLFTFGALVNPIAPGRLYWTGLNLSWVTENTCLKWTTSTTSSGRYGNGLISGAASIGYGVDNCPAPHCLICVEQ